MPDEACALTVSAESWDATAVLRTRGLLDSSTYRSLRDTIIKAALDEPDAVVVDVTHLSVPSESAWAVFTSARWHVDRWPEVPIVVVCEQVRGRSAMTRTGVTRFVPVYASIRAAMNALADANPPRARRRVRAAMPAGSASLLYAREFVSEWLTVWSRPELIPVAKIVVTSLVENVLEHTRSGPCVRIEFDGSAITVAVEDGSGTPAGLSEDRESANTPSGLRIVAALCRMWGNAPTTSGKTVWAVIGPENRL